MAANNFLAPPEVCGEYPTLSIVLHAANRSSRILPLMTCPVEFELSTAPKKMLKSRSDSIRDKQIFTISGLGKRLNLYNEDIFSGNCRIND
ncbi:hypothetical protein AVEN_59373-1 [Araneus ventricosus]|uniref:Uncharacterized protein n=1 Tax=Araneus ventricosus TaxID=182803 RepID=A0A4Y2UCP2_ARAVE|nr:hypothetical protein AVEN_59373-1 [Araneus ventricosus]